MARFVHIEYSTEHGGVNRMARGFAALGSFNVTIAALNALSAIGAPITRAASGTRNLLAGWSAARKQRAADRKLWDLALTDARIMADLSRAMGRDAADIGRHD